MRIFQFLNPLILTILAAGLVLPGCQTYTATIPAQSPTVDVPEAPGIASPLPAASSTPEEETMSPVPFAITSPAFSNGAAIPVRHTCSGEDLSPRLEWAGAPPGTKRLALIVEDPDAPAGNFIHWVLYNIPPELAALEEGLSTDATLPGIGLQGKSGFGRSGYGGPCPPPGKAHRYYFRLYALDLSSDLPAGLNAEKLKKAIAGHILAQAEWMGTFKR